MDRGRTPIDHVISRAEAADLAGILDLQRGAFGRLASSLGIDPCVMGPLTETLDDLKALYGSGTVFLKSVDADGALIGTVRGTPDADGDVVVMRLAVADGREGLGLGSALMLALEDEFPDAPRFVLFTGAEIERLVGLYERLGYRAFRTAAAPKGAPADAHIVFMEKRRAAQ